MQDLHVTLHVQENQARFGGAVDEPLRIDSNAESGSLVFVAAEDVEGVVGVVCEAKVVDMTNTASVGCISCDAIVASMRKGDEGDWGIGGDSCVFRPGPPFAPASKVRDTTARVNQVLGP
jgi:hypothetical protein